MASQELENEDESIWLSPEASQKLLENYKEKFLKKWEQKFAENMAENKDPNDIQTLTEAFIKEYQSSWLGKLEKCDPDIYEAYEEEEELAGISRTIDPAIRDLCIGLKKWTKETKRKNTEEIWKSQVIRGSREQVKLLMEIQKQLQAIQKFLREQEDVNRQLQKVINFAGGVLIMAFIVYLIKSFF